MPSNHHPDTGYLLDLSREAEDDLRDILQDTYEKWGENQVAIYEAILDKALSSLLANPRIGHQRPDLSSDYLAVRAGHHFMIYRISDKIIYVVRVLHERMDFGGRIP